MKTKEVKTFLFATGMFGLLMFFGLYGFWGVSLEWSTYGIAYAGFVLGYLIRPQAEKSAND